jgi:hypothetical protein
MLLVFEGSRIHALTHSLQGLAAPEHMAQAFTRAGTQGVASELLVQFAREIAGDDGLISIHDM